MAPPRLAAAQRAAWLTLRSKLHPGVEGLSVQATKRIFTAFDYLPFDPRERIDATWLPDEDMLRSRMVTAGLNVEGVARLEAYLQIARAALQPSTAQAQCPDARHIQIVDEGRSQAHLHSIVWADEASRQAGVRTTFTISKPRLEWLRNVYRSPHPGDATEAAFRASLFRLLARYDGLSGVSGAGNQAAVPPAVYEAFEDWACAPRGTVIEAFASPLNHRLTPTSPVVERPFYCSAFPGTFGSPRRVSPCVA